MPNFAKISLKIKKGSIQELNFVQLVCMTAICYRHADDYIIYNIL